MADLSMLKLADMRYESVLRDFPGSGEVSRLAGIIALMKAELAPDELEAYMASKLHVESAEDKKSRVKREQDAMALNRDSNSI